jgi:hypothetical protein
MKHTASWQGDEEPPTCADRYMKIEIFGVNMFPVGVECVFLFGSCIMGLTMWYCRC